MTSVDKRRNPAARPWTAPAPAQSLPVVARQLAERADRAIERADAKAATLAATAMAILAFVTQSEPGGPHRPAAAVLLLVGVGALFWGAGVVALAVAIFPRFTDSGTGNLTFFKDFPERFDLGRLQALTRAAEADPEGWLLAQAHASSRIATAKYHCIRVGMRLLGVGGLLALPWVLLH